MAIYPNKDYVDSVLDEINPKLSDYVVKVLKSKYGEEWWTEGTLSCLHEKECQYLTFCTNDKKRKESLDPEKLLKIITRKWNDCFSKPCDPNGKPMKPLDRSLAFLTYKIRCEVSHKSTGAKDYSTIETLTALSNIAEFIEPANKKTYNIVQSHITSFQEKHFQKKECDVDPNPNETTSSKHTVTSNGNNHKRKIYLISLNQKQADTWNTHFRDVPNVTVVCKDIRALLDEHPEIDTIVTSSDSFNSMSGGIDYTILQYFGDDLKNLVKKEVNEKYQGLQPVGTAVNVPFKDAKGKQRILIPISTMLYPAKLVDVRVIFQCMRSALIASKDSKNVVIPGFGGLCGQADPEATSILMRMAYDSILNYPLNLENYCDIIDELSIFEPSL